ncbi:methyltransferase [Streptomyces sp. CRN 30]|uniref:methyltransferase n=1 Tax=Streptomyces sp. CRN 30 TaxID=3075613 RepID=UPI002A7FC1E3|nr:methyltransferase [Streptomyces sp. CRN 30]
MPDPMRPPASRHHPQTTSPGSDPSRSPASRPHPTGPRSSLRTAVVWEVLKDALDRRVRATGGAVPGGVLDVLDTGGGSGNFAVRVAGLGHRVTVVDPSPNALFALERRAAEAGVADLVRGVQGDAHGLFDVVERDGYDAVLCHGVLEYVDDPAEGLGNAVAALRPGGVLSLLAAGLGGAVLARALAGHFTEARQALGDPDGRWGEGDPVPHRFTAEQLTALVEDAGLAVAAVHGVRVFADLVPGVLVDTEPGAVEALLKLEAAAAESPAFHAVATQLHVLGETRGSAGR